MPHIAQLARLMANLGYERSDPLCSDDLVMLHGGVQCENKNARLAAGVWEDQQKLLRGDRHAFLQAKKTPDFQGFKIYSILNNSLHEPYFPSEMHQNNRNYKNNRCNDGYLEPGRPYITFQGEQILSTINYKRVDTVYP